MLFSSSSSFSSSIHPSIALCRLPSSSYYYSAAAVAFVSVFVVVAGRHRSLYRIVKQTHLWWIHSPSSSFSSETLIMAIYATDLLHKRQSTNNDDQCSNTAVNIIIVSSVYIIKWLLWNSTAEKESRQDISSTGSWYAYLAVLWWWIDGLLIV